MEHRVSDDQFSADRPAPTLPALCGEIFLPAPMDIGPRRVCRACVAIDTALDEEPTPRPIDVNELYARENLIPRQRDRAGHRRRGALQRLMHRMSVESSARAIDSGDPDPDEAT